MLEAGEYARLRPRNEPVHYTDIELPFLASLKAHVLALGLNCKLFFERREITAASAKGQIAISVDTGVNSHNRESRHSRFFDLFGGARVHDRCSLAAGQRLRHALHVSVQIGLGFAKIAKLFLERIVFALHAAQQIGNLIQLVQPFQNVVAAFLAHAGVGRYGSDRFADCAGADNLALPVSHGQHDPAVHESPIHVAVIHLGIPLAKRNGGELRRGCAVLHQKRLYRIGASLPQFLVVVIRSDLVRVAFDLDLVIAVLLNQFRQAQQAWISVG